MHGHLKKASILVDWEVSNYNSSYYGSNFFEEKNDDILYTKNPSYTLLDYWVPTEQSEIMQYCVPLPITKEPDFLQPSQAVDLINFKKSPLTKDLKMVVGSLYLPKDDSKKPEGDDAHFVSLEAQTFGVADGVGGWIKKGIDASKYARDLMMNSRVAAESEPKGDLANCKDDPGLAEEFKVPVEEGDVVAGTDGVFDNLHEFEIEEIIKSSTSKVAQPGDMARLIANYALYNSFDRFADTPFARKSRKAGHRHKGGKVDDITAIVARIQSRD
ncbi:hypothetical protein ACH5RR_020529 [Cinchona calisaya]|uniref:Protein phosphatase n=1 Tax=Cinchona calisaya TaxID=153742 RepID=A0ABD2ZEQ1_9GENT